MGTGSGYPVEFGPGKNVVWKTVLAYGRSSPAVVGGQVYVTASEDGKLVTISLDAKTGTQVWWKEIPRARQQKTYAENDPASPSPAANETGVYVFYADFGLAAYNADGTERWRLLLGPFKNFYGMAASPIVVGETVIQVLDQQSGSTMLAIDRKSGKLKWKTERKGADDRVGNADGLPPNGEAAQLVVLGTTQVDGYFLDRGLSRYWVRVLRLLGHLSGTVRRKRFVWVGEPVHATSRAVDRLQIFRHGFDKRKYLERFALVAEQEGVEVHGYCIMDNHVHFLLVPIRGHEAVGRLFLRVHTWWALRFHKPNDRSGHLFGSRFRSCLLDSAHYLATVRYIDLNPQAAGMVADPLTDEIDPYLELMMANWRYRFSNDPRRYREFLRETRREEQARIERALRNGFPLGSEEWVAQLEQESHRRLHPAPPGRQPVTWFTA